MLSVRLLLGLMVCLILPFAGRTQDSHVVTCALDPLLEFDGLWQTTPESLDEMFTAKDKGFSKNPHFRIQARTDQKQALFVPQPYQNISNEMSLFGTDSPSPSLAALDWDNDRAVRLRIEFGPFDQRDEAEAAYELIRGKLEPMLPGTTKPWYFQHDPTETKVRRAETKIVGKGVRWSESKATVLLSLTRKQPGGFTIGIRVVPAGEEKRLELEEFIATISSAYLNCSLDPLFELPRLWQMTRSEFETIYSPPPGLRKETNPYFQWLNESKTRARLYRRARSNFHVNLRMINQSTQAEEVVANFTGDRISSVQISIYNQGDSGKVTPEQFQKLYQRCGKYLGSIFSAKASVLPSGNTGVFGSSGYQWYDSLKGSAILEYNPQAFSAASPQPHYLQIKLQPPQGTTRTVSGRQPLGNVVRDADGSTWIKNIPMIHQGRRGYCVVASCERVFEYFGKPIDQYQMASVFGSEVQRGTNREVVQRTFQEFAPTIGMKYELLMRQHHLATGGSKPSMSIEEFRAMIKSSIDSGIPLLWSLDLNKLPEVGMLPIESTADGHMRLINGYNLTTGKLIYSDSLGLGYEKKIADLHKSYRATNLVFRLLPR